MPQADALYKLYLGTSFESNNLRSDLSDFIVAVLISYIFILKTTILISASE